MNIQKVEYFCGINYAYNCTFSSEHLKCTNLYRNFNAQTYAKTFLAKQNL